MVREGLLEEGAFKGGVEDGEALARTRQEGGGGKTLLGVSLVTQRCDQRKGGTHARGLGSSASVPYLQGSNQGQVSGDVWDPREKAG